MSIKISGFTQQKKDISAGLYDNINGEWIQRTPLWSYPFTNPLSVDISNIKVHHLVVPEIAIIPIGGKVNFDGSSSDDIEISPRDLYISEYNAHSSQYPENAINDDVSNCYGITTIEPDGTYMEYDNNSGIFIPISPIDMDKKYSRFTEYEQIYPNITYEGTMHDTNIPFRVEHTIPEYGSGYPGKDLAFTVTYNNITYNLNYLFNGFNSYQNTVKVYVCRAGIICEIKQESPFPENDGTVYSDTAIVILFQSSPKVCFDKELSVE